MVGVPQSKGCEACRKQKKSCEGTAIPCVRCKRLKIPCIGRGQQRFKFQDENIRFENKSAQPKPAKKQKASSVRVAVAPAQKCSPPADSVALTGQPQALSISRMPGNQLTRLVASFADHIDPNLDTRFQPPWGFSKLLQAIPSRLGRNPALDASAAAVLAAYQVYRTRRLDGSGDSPDTLQQHCLGHYNRALKALRLCLDDEAEARSSETLCSTMMLLMFETLSGPVNQKVLGHAGGAANILKARGAATARNDFEWKVVLSLRGPVIFQALFSEKMLFNDEEWFNLVQNPHEDEGVLGRLLMSLSRVPNLLHRVRRALSTSSVDYEELQRLRLLLRTIRNAHAFDLKQCVDAFYGLEQDHPDPLLRPREVMALHCQRGRHLGTALTIETHLLFLLSAVDYPTQPLRETLTIGTVQHDLDEWMQLVADRALDVSDLAERVACHRPLGAFYMDFVLKGAYIAAGDRGTQLRILGQIWEFAYDMMGSQANVNLEELAWIRNWLTANDMRMKHAALAAGGADRVLEITEDGIQ